MVRTHVHCFTVSVEATSGYYEGLFMMARLPGDSTAAYGTFTVDNAEWFKMLACYTQTGVGNDNNVTELIINISYCLHVWIVTRCSHFLFICMLSVYLSCSKYVYLSVC